MVSITTEYISAGGNRHPAAADWDSQSGVLAFGADNNIALWNPADNTRCGIYSLLVGHTDKVTAVRFYTCSSTGKKLILSGSVDRTIRIWQDEPGYPYFSCVGHLEGHEGSINTIAVAEGSNIVASGAADGTVKLWRIDEQSKGTLVNTISLKPRYFSLTLALRVLEADVSAKPMVLAVAGTRNTVQIYVAQDTSGEPDFQLCATLSGHEAWVRSLAFQSDIQSSSGDFLLASASQDKYIRLWRVQRGEVAPVVPKDSDDPMIGGFEQTLSNKAHTFDAVGSKYSITFEALLFGHEDWIYTVAWNPDPKQMQLVSSSADNSLIIWEPDPVSGVWISKERMGEISVQKGSTSATGSTGGFWIGLWAPGGKEVVSLGRTGSWRRWQYLSEVDHWVQTLGISGHVRSVSDIEWEPKGGYLLSTSSDQTTRVHAEWKRDGAKSWHEFSRAQIHGYDLNCIDSLGPTRFISGADEKLLRVFNEPKAVAQLLNKLSGFQQLAVEEMPDTANIPVLGLSNKAAGDEVPLGEDMNGLSDEQPSALPVSLDMDHPPFEDHLARYTLWPEHEKLYGHGYEISAVAVSNDRSIIATACKASSIDHAVIRLYDAADWHEIRPPLTAHSLTVTSLSFSSDDRYLLSVGRDRQWAVFERHADEPSRFSLLKSNPKGHSRMILGAAWAPLSNPPAFATAGRDKTVKLWQMTDGEFVCKSTISVKDPVTALSFLPTPRGNLFYLAVGEDNGAVSLHKVATDSLETDQITSFDKLLSPSRSITYLSWRPNSDNMIDSEQKEGSKYELAVASEDTSLRIYAISDIPF
ncbi:hypothetical protein DTO027B9_633 [Paecilomyces variotii]|nr:hypothetical protein DTO027B9_633 [Paecilomyces variotii]